MSTIILRLLPVNGGDTVVPHALQAVAHYSGSWTAIAVVGGLAVFIALARLLRHMLSVVSHLLSSAGAAVAVLVTLLGAGTVLLTTVVVYVETH